MIRDDIQIDELLPFELKSIAIIARYAKARTGINVSLRDNNLFQNLEKCLRYAGELHLLRTLIKLKIEISDRTAISERHLERGHDDSRRVPVETYNDYKIRVKYYDQLAA
ncbi:MAG: hypothetical protein AAF431_15265 [Pseudomonadota bacterium]